MWKQSASAQVCLENLKIISIIQTSKKPEKEVHDGERVYLH
jgi:hypothetical protein